MQNRTIVNETLTTANTEYKVTLTNPAKFTLKCRTSDDLKVAFQPGESGTKYVTVPAGSAYSEENIRMQEAKLDIYIQCANAGKVAEIVYWTH